MIHLNTATRDGWAHSWAGDEILHLYPQWADNALCGAGDSRNQLATFRGDGRPMCPVCAREAVRREAEDDGRSIR